MPKEKCYKHNLKYKILDHPSELRLLVWGKTIEELFSNAVFAMADVLKKVRKKGIKEEEIKIKSIDKNSLLVDFLSEVLAKSQINKCVYQVSKIRYQANKKEAGIEAKIRGCPVDHFDEDIKAVTYEDLDIKRVDEQWQTIIVFDI